MLLMTSPEQLIEALERGPTIVIPMIRQADPMVLKRRPAVGKWSIHEHACHLAEADQLFQRRLEIMMAAERPIIKSYDPGRDDPEDALLHVELETALHRYQTLRQDLVNRLRNLTAKDWFKSAEHDEYNSYSIFTMIRHLVLHDFFHAYRIEELLLRKDWPQPMTR
jgi:DinB superfamily